MTVAAKAFLMLINNKKVRNLIVGIIVGTVLVLIAVFSMYSESSSALADAASAEYSFWQKTTPETAGYSCQGEKYCGHFDAALTDWCCYFVGTCADNAGINPEDIGFSPSTNNWINNLKELGKLKSAGKYTPQRGNLVFFNYDGRQNYNSTGFVAHIGIISRVSGDTITVIAGNEYNGQTENWCNVSYVNQSTLNVNDDSIACYGAIGADSSITSNGLNNVTRDVICHNEIGVLYSSINTEYGTVIADDNGALSVGVYGWHGNKALALLQCAYQINNTQIKNVSNSFSSTGSSIINSIENNANWSSYIPDITTCACIKAMLLTDAGKQAQDETSLQDAQTYIDICKENGLTDSKAIVYCCDILNQWGVSSFNANVYGNGSNGVLCGVTNSMSLDDIYHSHRAWSDSSYDYFSRRQWTYDYLVNISDDDLNQITI